MRLRALPLMGCFRTVNPLWPLESHGKLFQCQPGDGIAPITCNYRRGLEDKTPRVKLRVRDCETGIGFHPHSA